MSAELGANFEGSGVVPREPVRPDVSGERRNLGQSPAGPYISGAASFPSPVRETGSAGGQGGSRRSSVVPGGVSKDGLVEEASVKKDAVRLRVQPLRDERKFRYDVAQARKAKPVAFSVTKADRLDAYQAGELLHTLHVRLLLDLEVEEHIMAFDKALFFEHTLNGASVLQPDRGNIVVGDKAYSIAEIHNILGQDIRRFFRAFADDVASVNREVLDNFIPGDPESVEKHGQLLQVAFDRGIEKYPYLAHDSADACTFLSVEERNALAASKSRVLTGLVSDPYKRFEQPKPILEDKRKVEGSKDP